MKSTNSDEVKVDERKTRELCGSERDGLRCMRPKGHEHKHEAFTAHRTLRWD